VRVFQQPVRQEGRVAAQSTLVRENASAPCSAEQVLNRYDAISWGNALLKLAPKAQIELFEQLDLLRDWKFIKIIGQG